MKNGETMLQKGSWPYFSNGSSDHACNERASGSANAANKTSNHCSEASRINSLGDELCDDDPILSDQDAKVEGDSYHYLLTQPVDDLSYFDCKQDDKGNGDLLYCNWPEIQNFEDVDKMFRDCDSTFGLGIDDGDDFGWFSSSNAIEESNDATKPSLKTPDPDFGSVNGATGHVGAFSMNNIGTIADETDKNFMPISWNSSLEKRDANSRSVAMPLSCANQGISHFDSDTQKFSVKDQLKIQTQSGIKRDNHFLENGETFVHLSNINQLEGAEQPLGNSGYECIFSSNVFQNSLHSQNPCMGSSSNDPSNQAFSTLIASVVKLEDNGQSISQKESSYSSNQMHSVESTRGLKRSSKKKGISRQNGFSAKQSNHGGLVVQDAMFSNPITSRNQAASFESEVEGQSEVNANGTTSSTQTELDSSNVQEGSCLSSVLDEVSLEASSLRQLQHVMEKLDIKTKLCIRDSLYRLARSAEQRHKCTSLNGGSRFDKEGDGVSASAKTDKCNGFMDMETDTNPIDRSIAHLLFHRPSDPSVRTSNKAASSAFERPISREGSSSAVAE